MKIFITFLSLFLLVLTAKSQTTVSGVTVGAQQWDITYNTGTFDSFQSDISTAGGNSTSLGEGSIAAPWWNENASYPTKETFATGLYNANNALTNVRFAFKEYEDLVGTTDYVNFTTQGGGTDLQSSEGSAIYAVSAVQVPAPLPILGILPVVGFLKRMRRRQRA